MDYERLFVDHLGLVDQVVQFIARRHRLSPQDAEELSADVRLKLIENDYSILRRFGGRSSLRTYLTAVIQRHFLDARIATWGKWRPSAVARRLGPVAVLLDRLVSRDDFTFDQAVEILRANHGITLSRDELQGMYAQLPCRTGRHFVDEKHLEEIAAPEPDGRGIVHTMEDAGGADRVEEALRTVLNSLAPQDRLILKMRFSDGFQVSLIARLLVLDSRPLYRRLERIMGNLKCELEARGVDRGHVQAIVGHPRFELDPILAEDPAEN